MRFKFTGDFKELEKFRDKVVAAPKTLRTVNEQLCEEAIDLVREGFEKQEDPYGNKWEGHSDLTKELRPGGRILEGETGNLKSSWHRLRVSVRGFSIANAKKYAAFHQDGTGIHGPKRRAIKPINGKSLRIPSKGGAVFLGSVKGAPKRPMVPDDGKALPERWKRRFVETAHEVMTELIR
jgi:hypothetical protein